MIEAIIIAIAILGICGIIVYARKREIQIRDDYELQLEMARADAVKRSRASIQGKVLEHIVPYLPNWKYTPSDARFLGSPIDYIVFDGLSEDEVKELIIVEIKTGNSKATKRQRSIRDAIKEGKVRYELL